MADQKPTVTLGYSRSSDQYFITQIQGNAPAVNYIWKRGGTTGPVVRETLTAHVGDWMDEAHANALGLVADLTVRPYRLDA